MTDQKVPPNTEPELELDEDKHGSGLAKTFHEIEQEPNDNQAD